MQYVPRKMPKKGYVALTETHFTSVFKRQQVG